MRRIIIDLTDIKDWHGHHGGTQRVVYGIAKEFYLSASKEFYVVYIAYSASDKSFYETSFAPIYDRTEKQNITDEPIKTAAISIQTRAKQFVRPYIPETIKKNKYARTLAKRSVSLGVSLAKNTRKTFQRGKLSAQSSSKGKLISFSDNDTVLILGKPWDYPGMELSLTNEKAKTGFKLVQVIYDLIIPLYPHLHYPSLFKNYTQYVYEAIYNSDLLLPISKSTEKDLKIFAKSLNLLPPKTKVIRLADEIDMRNDASRKPDEQVATKFIACIGTIEIRKNHTLLYYVYKLAAQQGIGLPQLVIVGARGWLTGDFQYLVEHDPSMKNKVLILDNVNDQGLYWIYENCMFSVYPSFYEGWGLPVAESLARGKLAIASNTSSIPEICGDLIDYFSPYDVQACLNSIIKYLESDKLDQKQTQIKKLYKPTSWSDTFREVSDGISRLREQPPNFLV